MTQIVHRLYEKIVDTVNPRLLAVFFVLFTALFLGDGKQSFIDFFLSCAMLGIYFWDSSTHHKDSYTFSDRTRLDNTVIWFLWGVVFLYLLVRTGWSDSISYSFTSINRFFIGFMAFSLASSFAKDPDIPKKYVHLLFWFLVCAILSSITVSLFPTLGTALPLMNLLFANYGHNSLSYLLVFLLPIVYGRFVLHRSWKTGILVFLTIILIFSTFARGVWILTGIYTIVFIGRHFRELSKTKTVVLCTIALFFFTAFFGLFRIDAGVHFNPRYASFFQRYVLKESVTDNRIQYWNQAIRAIRERPMFGSGPGTFFLQSERFQKIEGMYSWYAHNSVLQMLTELGIVGSIPILLLFISVIVAAYRRTRKSQVSSTMFIIFDGCVLTLLYSLYDYSLDFFVIWILLWTGFGILVGTNEMHWRHMTIHRFLIRTTAAFVVFFCIFFCSDYIQFLVTDTQTVPKFFIPINGLTTKSYLKRISEKKIPLSPTQRNLILFFHARDPEVHDLLGDSYEALRLEPLNTIYLHKVFIRVVDNPDALTTFILTYATTVQNSSLDEKVVISRDIKDLMQFTDTNALVAFVGEPDTVQEFLSKFYYYLGFSFLSMDSSKTRTYWTFARDLSPGWGYFHVELARLEYAYFHDSQRANKVLDDCKSYTSAFGQCADVTLDSLTLGDRNQYENIARIPNL